MPSWAVKILLLEIKVSLGTDWRVFKFYIE